MIRFLHAFLTVFLVLLCIYAAGRLFALFGPPRVVAPVVGLGHGAFSPHLDRDETEAWLEGPQEGPSRPQLVGGRVRVRFRTDSAALGWVSWVNDLPPLLVSFFTVLLLRRLLGDAGRREPFRRRNAQRLRWIGWLFVALGLYDPLTNFALGMWSLHRLQLSGLPLTPLLDLDVDFLLTGCLALVLAVVFQHGAALEEERRLTV